MISSATPTPKVTYLPSPGQINFPKRRSAGSLGKLEEGWKRGKGKRMGPGKGADESKDDSMQGHVTAELRLFRMLLPPAFDFRDSRFFNCGGRG